MRGIMYFMPRPKGGAIIHCRPSEALGFRGPVASVTIAGMQAKASTAPVLSEWIRGSRPFTWRIKIHDRPHSIS